MTVAVEDALAHYNLGLAFRQKGYFTEALRDVLEYAELATERGREGLAPLERASRKAPFAVVRTADEKETTAFRPRNRRDSDDGSAEDVPRGFVDDAVRGLRDVPEEHLRHLSGCGKPRTP